MRWLFSPNGSICSKRLTKRRSAFGMTCGFDCRFGLAFRRRSISRETSAGRQWWSPSKTRKVPRRSSHFAASNSSWSADPQVSTTPYPGRTMELVSLQLVPDPLDDLAQITDLSEQKDLDRITVEATGGSHALLCFGQGARLHAGDQRRSGRERADAQPLQCAGGAQVPYADVRCDRKPHRAAQGPHPRAFHRRASNWKAPIERRYARRHPSAAGGTTRWNRCR
ncbi:MAG: hypothetical protein ACLR8Y_09155 [Alistipes indistinctus]